MQSQSKQTTVFEPGDEILYGEQLYEVTVTPQKTATIFTGEYLVWAYRLPDKTIMRYFYPHEVQLVRKAEQ